MGPVADVRALLAILPDLQLHGPPVPLRVLMLPPSLHREALAEQAAWADESIRNSPRGPKAI